ncbi:MAG: helix-turn-helix transcriptional regulator [Paracoccaceae bacterium]|nr:helix-turn-helix transcriptional regulator [Paracoccaceae bacterium]MDE3121282.1 helix-turn-helix transcriptional regulator [Paracoccaceae bacterium]MDE3237726.1 helix-turn-helix transcriptional regulator [Paracoccaceae bacterium]
MDRVEDPSERFRRNLFRLMREKGMSAAALSRAAGLNPRAVKDIEERRANSPRIATVVALARGLGVSEATLLGLPSAMEVSPELSAFLARFDPEQQDEILQRLSEMFPSAKAAS